MVRTELVTPDELEKIIEAEIGFIVTHMIHEFSEDVITIHYTNCGDDAECCGSQSIGITLDLKCDPNVRLACYHYNSFSEIKADFPNSKHCDKCQPFPTN